MRIFILEIFLVVAFCQIGLSQKAQSFSMIRDYKANLTIAISESHFSSIVLNSYGELILQSDTKSNRYCFQGHELEQELGVYLFPSRTYSQICKRFIQPDPESQYNSPYGFVGADPVNIIDRNGKQGKPLILYNEESRFGTSSLESAEIEDMRGEIDAYYSPISDFVNGEISADMSEWNGSVFIDCHSGLRGNFVSERYLNGERIKTQIEHMESAVETPSGVRQLSVKPSAIADRLGKISESTNVELKSVVVGGCQGGRAADRLSEAIADNMERTGRPSTFEVHGLEDSYVAQYRSRETVMEFDRKFPNLYSANSERVLPKQVSFYAMDPTDKNYRVEQNEDGQIRMFKQNGEEYPMASGADLQDLVNGRIPTNMSRCFDSYSIGFADF